MIPIEGHVGRVDVDIMINYLALQDESYQNMLRILKKTDTFIAIYYNK